MIVQMTPDWCCIEPIVTNYFFKKKFCLLLEDPTEETSQMSLLTGVTTKKSPNVYKSSPKMITQKMIDFDTFTKIA